MQDDMELEQRVWQRIAGETESCPCPRPDLPMMILRRQEETAWELRYLAQRSSGLRRERLTALRYRCMNHADTLRGMLILGGSRQPQMGKYQPENASAQRILARAYRRSTQNREDYLILGGEYAPCYEQLAREEAQTMTELLALIGEGGIS